MSLSKYMQVYKNNGFFLGSIVRVTITDADFFGQELILSKGNKVLQSKTITGTQTDFFTDESGTLSLYSDNGTSIISGEVEVSAYGTYNVTLNSVGSDSNREIYPDNTDVLLFVGDSEKTVEFAYTGDEAPTSVVSSDSNVATATINDNVVTVTRSSGDSEATCTVTATVAKTNKYNSQSVNFNVRRYGSVGSWSDASDETIVNMVAAADRGEINLRDYWSVGESRVVTLSAITKDANSVIISQPEQQIELVLLYDSISDLKYELVQATASNRKQPSFVVGLKNCLRNLTPIDQDVKQTAVSTRYSSSSSYSRNITTYLPITGNSNPIQSKLHTWLNQKFFNALPSSLRSIFKDEYVRYCGGYIYTNKYVQDAPANYCVLTAHRNAIKQKVALPSSYEINADTISLASTSTYRFDYLGSSVWLDSSDIFTQYVYGISTNLNYDLTYEGTKNTYYNTNANKIKKQGIDGNACPYYTRTTAENHVIQAANNNYGKTSDMSAFALINASGSVTALDKSTYASTYAGLAPIMFI